MPRDGKLTASQFSSAAGINPYCSRAEAWRLATGRKVFDGNAATKHGNDCEPLAIAAYEAHTGDILTDRQKWFEIEQFGAHVDGITSVGVVEVKCPVGELYTSVPAHYMAQIQGQMHIAARDICHFVAWTPDELRIWTVPRDAYYWDWLKPLLVEFWNYTQNDIEPPRLKRKPIPPEVLTERIA